MPDLGHWVGKAEFSWMQSHWSRYGAGVHGSCKKNSIERSAVVGVGPLLFPLVAVQGSTEKKEEEEVGQGKRGLRGYEVARLRRKKTREGHPQLGGTAISDLLLSWNFLYSHHMETTDI